MLVQHVNAAALTRFDYTSRMPDRSVIRRILFAEGLVGLGRVAGSPRCSWRDGTIAVLHPLVTSRLAGVQLAVRA